MYCNHRCLWDLKLRVETFIVTARFLGRPSLGSMNIFAMLHEKRRKLPLKQQGCGVFVSISKVTSARSPLIHSGALGDRFRKKYLISIKSSRKFYFDILTMKYIFFFFRTPISWSKHLSRVLVRKKPHLNFFDQLKGPGFPKDGP